MFCYAVIDRHKLLLTWTIREYKRDCLDAFLINMAKGRCSAKWRWYYNRGWRCEEIEVQRVPKKTMCVLCHEQVAYYGDLCLDCDSGLEQESAELPTEHEEVPNK